MGIAKTFRENDKVYIVRGFALDKGWGGYKFKVVKRKPYDPANQTRIKLVDRREGYEQSEFICNTENLEKA
ncbi:putative phage tail protein [Streptomyces phage Coruscant]|uniref:Putative phage tail protein n=1 Tax=Streptomyces phage Coruscant TaxID=2739834 RepID=A0A7G4AWF1_9CAUD|nr:putative phage tail protein [Streptomyces phage Coruscant]QMP84341.1 putative phage tail protein [Streptomyces phage Coruscant]